MNPVSDSKFNQAEHIARALYGFFSEKEKQSFFQLRKVLYQLVTLQIDKGRGFLTKENWMRYQTPQSITCSGRRG